MLSADHKYSVYHSENLSQSIQMQVSNKQKPLSEFFASFLKYTFNFEHFQATKMTLIVYVFSKLWTVKYVI